MKNPLENLRQGIRNTFLAGTATFGMLATEKLNAQTIENQFHKIEFRNEGYSPNVSLFVQNLEKDDVYGKLNTVKNFIDHKKSIPESYQEQTTINKDIELIRHYFEEYNQLASQAQNLTTNDKKFLLDFYTNIILRINLPTIKPLFEKEETKLFTEPPLFKRD